MNELKNKPMSGDKPNPLQAVCIADFGLSVLKVPIRTMSELKVFKYSFTQLKALSLLCELKSVSMSGKLWTFLTNESPVIHFHWLF